MELHELLEITQKERSQAKPIQIRCCTAAGCLSSNSQAIKDNLDTSVKAAGLEDTIQVTGVGCMRLCCQGPLVQVDIPENHTESKLYEKVTPEDATQIIAGVNGAETNLQQGDLTQPFFTNQLPIVLENSGKIDPERIQSYIAAEGYQALYQVLREMKPGEVVETITRSGLRGRGGAGYPTGLKWATVAKSAGERKFVICNADEGDPGAFMDRSVLESDPHRVLEGMAIAAYSIGATQGYIYVRAEYPIAIHRLETAIRQSQRLGLLGSQIFESPFDFKIDIRIGAGAYVCGEETALMASIEGKRGVPHPRPPYPAESGLWGYPTLINNVETFANIAPIIRKGADWFANIGTAKSKGTKVFALAGKIRNTGLIEVPMGTSLQQIVEEMGGGVPDHGIAKAVQTGGPSGGCIPASAFATPVDYESLTALGSMMGSGGMIVMDQTTNMVDVARFFMEFCMDESCGKCIPCRVGTVQLYQLLTKISKGEAAQTDLQLLEELCDMVKQTSLCGLGQSAPNPVFSTLRYFHDEYLALIR
ncbi:SLBB domain-containing protein [Anabaena cylindrica FACHB-243]|uniref:NAD(P)-dependent nickel-iron dehydrogenase flavin-containing subunit n=1 Tax=Anabaena cylindrica (strain ATCC 27899 / PCC 7122) TaxID=272123 RepID=K9ZMS7_ANACC|nr:MULTISPECIES: NuoF family protein [Anabaena]AFZ59620.1 NAD(P)-dependent nickel-iron dehydrogenase flavin-containing subunit [Anabaena cylindrica PCC 7122]MBD2418717.1 SLBB domain-containing protein [Anabaena cylindrica FACHB-243]MBY5281656.1 NADH-quinone oxidoreductase subunit L [Anabaena sp. CCAP 1446/1C]MBY5309182.1 NADH-quinone oxidoreductase subunit L [Anabaena sp. CCAP 1446/1C]MCM2406280.1 NAD(P)H-dependent oxidoreductase subunit E [Anabaena sp. CCAP 1446/1C]